MRTHLSFFYRAGSAPGRRTGIRRASDGFSTRYCLRLRMKTTRSFIYSGPRRRAFRRAKLASMAPSSARVISPATSPICSTSGLRRQAQGRQDVRAGPLFVDHPSCGLTRDGNSRCSQTSASTVCILPQTWPNLRGRPAFGDCESAHVYEMADGDRIGSAHEKGTVVHQLHSVSRERAGCCLCDLASLEFGHVQQRACAFV